MEAGVKKSHIVAKNSRSLVNIRRKELGMSMDQLGKLLGVSATSIASLERNELRGTVQVKTLRKALKVMGEELKLDVAPSATEPSTALLHESATQRARMVADEVIDTMALEGQSLTASAQERIFRKALAVESAKL